MQEALPAGGYQLVGWDESADIRVINTCTVTAKSDRTCRHEIHSARRLDPGCLIVVTGCYAQVDPDAVAAIPGVDLVVGNQANCAWRSTWRSV
jgi:threonylcarbamoyladenosine tRNA methylthiotransferase MtaB